MLTLWLTGTMLILVQALAALPWLAVLEPELLRSNVRKASTWLYAVLGIAVAGVVLGQVLHIIQEPDRLEMYGRLYAAVLQLQLTAGVFIAVLGLLLLLWPKGGAVAMAAFREGIRQPLFWSIAAVAAGLMFLYLFVPFFTFGEDIKFMKLLGYDTAMLAAGAFGVLAAGMSITEEIEGRTAITLISKPVSRRQFLLGKYVGIFLAALALIALLGWVFEWTIYMKPVLDPMDDSSDPLQAQVEPYWTGLVAGTTGPAGDFLRGVVLWFSSTTAVFLGLAIGSCQVMILTALAAALATRLPMVVNLVTCLGLFFLGNLAPVLLEVAGRMQSGHAQEHAGQGSMPLELVRFMARLFDTLLPALEFFNLGPAVIRDRPLPVGDYLLYVGSVAGYSLLYTAIALLVGLILFEDRDLA